MSSRKHSRLLGEYGYDAISMPSNKRHKEKVVDTYTDQTIEIPLWRLEKHISSGNKLTEKEKWKLKLDFINLEKDSTLIQIFFSERNLNILDDYSKRWTNKFNRKVDFNYQVENINDLVSFIYAIEKSIPKLGKNLELLETHLAH